MALPTRGSGGRHAERLAETGRGALADGTDGAPRERHGEALPVGTIFGDVTTTNFRFTVHHPDVTATMYVSFEHEGEAYLAQVLRVEREAGGATRSWGEDARGGPADRLVAHALVIGRRVSKGRLALPTTPARTGAAVFRASAGLTRSALGLSDTGAYLGHLRGLDVEVHLDVNAMVQKHCSILAKTGAGKSYALGVLMEELLKHKVPIVVVDPHGEHASLAAPNSNGEEVPLMRRFKVRPRSYAEQVVQYVLDQRAIPDGVPFKLDGRDLSARDLSDFLGGALTSAQIGVIHQAVRDLKTKGHYALDDIIAAVEGQEGSTKWPVLHALEDLSDLGLFSDEPTPVKALVKEGQATILNLKGAPPYVQELVVARVASDLFEARKLGSIAAHLFVLEEAHNFCPERNLAKAASGDVLRTLASEGRKFGMGLCVVSQRPAKVDKNVLSQCHTQIILKVTNPNDLKAISSSVEGLPGGIEEEIQALPVGVALVSDPTIAVPLFCEIRPRETRHGGSGVDVVPAEKQEAGRARPAARARAKPPASSPHAAAHGPSPPLASAEDAMLREIERADHLVARAHLSVLSPGRLEALLAEIEGLEVVLDELAQRQPLDRARVSSLQASVGAHRDRVLALVRGRGGVD